MENWEIIIPKGATAPYQGVLVPEYIYREYQANDEKLAYFESRYEESVKQCEGPTISPVLTMVIGFVIGGMAVAVLKR